MTLLNGLSFGTSFSILKNVNIIMHVGYHAMDQIYTMKKKDKTLYLLKKWTVRKSWESL